MPRWSIEDVALEALRAPMGVYLRADARVIERPGWYEVITPSRPTPGANEIYLCELDDADADRAIDETIARHRALGVPWKWIVHPWSRPHDLADRLARRARDAWDARAMYIDPREPIAGAPIEVVRVDGDDPRFAAVFAEGWQSDPAQTSADLRASPPSHRHFLALDRGEPIGAASGVAHARSTYFTAAVVLPAHRGRGAYRALVGARMRDAAERGDTLVTTQARDATSAPILERLGFRTAFAMRCFTGE